MEKKKVLVGKSKFPNANPGIEVKPGENYASLSVERRKQLAVQHENRWKTRYNAARGTVSGTQSFDRG